MRTEFALTTGRRRYAFEQVALLTRRWIYAGAAMDRLASETLPATAPHFVVVNGRRAQREVMRRG